MESGVLQDPDTGQHWRPLPSKPSCQPSGESHSEGAGTLSSKTAQSHRPTCWRSVILPGKSILVCRKLRLPVEPAAGACCDSQQHPGAHSPLPRKRETLPRSELQVKGRAP